VHDLVYICNKHDNMQGATVKVSCFFFVSRLFEIPNKRNFSNV